MTCWRGPAAGTTSRGESWTCTVNTQSANRIFRLTCGGCPSSCAAFGASAPLPPAMRGSRAAMPSHASAHGGARSRAAHGALRRGLLLRRPPAEPPPLVAILPGQRCCCARRARRTRRRHHADDDGRLSRWRRGGWRGEAERRRWGQRRCAGGGGGRAGIDAAMALQRQPRAHPDGVPVQRRAARGAAPGRGDGRRAAQGARG